MLNQLLKLRLLLVSCSIFLLVGCASSQVSNEVSVEQSEYYQGKAILPFLAEQQAKTPEEAIQKADQAMSVNDIDRALFNYIRAYELDERNTEALIRIGDIHYSRDSFSISFRAYQLALNVDPEQGRALKGTGMIQLQRKSYALAETTLKHSVERLLNEPASQQSLLESYIGLGIINDLGGNFSNSVLYYHEAEKLAPKSAMVKSNLGYSYYMQEKWPLAEQTFSKALKINNSYKPAWKNLGLTYARQEKYLEALGALEEVMETAQAYNDIGYICMISQRYEQASYFFRKAIKEHPQYYTVAQQNLTRVKRLLASNPDGRSKL